MKRHLFYTFLTIFIATSAVTLLGITGVVHIVDGYLWPLVTAFLIELAGAVVAVFRRAEFFDDPPEKSVSAGFISIPDHKKEMSAADAKHRQEVFRITKLYSTGKGILIPESILRQEEEQYAQQNGYQWRCT